MIPVFYSTRCEDGTAMEDLSRELSGITNPHFAYGVQLWVNSLIPLTGKLYKMKEHREKSPISFFLQTSLSLSYLLHNSMFIGLFGKVLNCKNEINKKKEENKGQEN